MGKFIKESEIYQKATDIVSEYIHNGYSFCSDFISGHHNISGLMTNGKDSVTVSVDTYEKRYGKYYFDVADAVEISVSHSDKCTSYGSMQKTKETVATYYKLGNSFRCNSYTDDLNYIKECRKLALDRSMARSSLSSVDFAKSVNGLKIAYRFISRQPGYKRIALADCEVKCIKQVGRNYDGSISVHFLIDCRKPNEAEWKTWWLK